MRFWLRVGGAGARALTRARADPNVYPSGKVCLSILNDEKGWKPSVTVKQILTGIQELLDTPNNGDAAQEPAWKLYNKSQPDYIKRVKEEVAKYPHGGGGGGGADVVIM